MKRYGQGSGARPVRALLVIGLLFVAAAARAADPYPDDHGDLPPEATLLDASTGTVHVLASLETDTDRDCFRINGTTGVVYRVAAVTSGVWDVSLRLLRVDGRSVAAQSSTITSSEEGRTWLLWTNLEANGYAYLEVSGFADFTTGEYQFTVVRDTVQLARITLTNLLHTYDGSTKPASAITTPGNLAYTLTYDGAAAAPSNAGTYHVVARITETNWSGQAEGVLVIEQDSATLNLLQTNQTYSGAPRVVTALTQPPGLNVTFTYDGQTQAPSEAGHYSVTGRVVEANWSGGVTGILNIARATDVVQFGATNQFYSGSAVTVTVSVASGSPALLRYDGSLLPPVEVGSYPVVAVVDARNWTATGRTVLTISPGPQSITFPAVPWQHVTNRLRLAATSSSGLPVRFAVLSGPAILSGGTNLAFSAAGLVRVAAYQDGDARWQSARPVTNQIRVGRSPAVADYDGDGRSDLPVFNPPNGAWYIFNSAASEVVAWNEAWGWSTARPVSGEFNGDGVWDQAVFDTAGGYWYIKTVSGALLAWRLQWGWSTAKPVPGDYDGDGRFDLAVVDTATGRWYVKRLDGTVIAWNVNWGWAGAVFPALGD